MGTRRTLRTAWLAMLLVVGLAGRASAQNVTVTLDLIGSGSGTVVSSPAGFNCSGGARTCTATFATNTTVMLTATPASGQTFGGWSGACTGTGGCTIAASTGLLVAATFNGASAYVFYHQDAIGSVRAITNEAGATVATHDYQPFGEDVAPLVGDPMRFAGKELDAETGQNYFGARYYRNTLGRFTTVDPMTDTRQASVEPQRWNRYAYALDNPLKFGDPDGKNPLLVMGAAGAAVFGGWQIYQNVSQGRPWYDNVGVEATKGALIGATMGLAAPALATASVADAGIAATGSVGAPLAGRIADAVTEAATVGRGTTVLGHSSDGYVSLAKAIGARYFFVADSEWNAMTQAQQWAQNAKFLDQVVARRDLVVLATQASAAFPNSFFSRELEYLYANGYTLAESGIYMLPPAP